MNVCLSCVCPLCMPKRLDRFDDIFCVCSSGSRNDLNSQCDRVGPNRGGAQTGIFRLIGWKYLLINGCFWLEKK